MKVTQINRIRGYRVFSDFSWPATLHPFGRYNLIYGWNGSGKTTLAQLFRHIQTGSPLEEGEFQLSIDGTSFYFEDLPTSQFPPIRIFDREFVTSTIMPSNGTVDPIYYLGKESVERQKQVQALRGELSQLRTDISDTQSQEATTQKALDTLCIDTAKTIKEILIGPHTTKYNNYDKRRFRDAIEKLDNTSAAAARLSEEERTLLRKQKDSQPKGDVSRIGVDLPLISRRVNDSFAVLQRSVVSQVLDELVSDGEVGAWIQKGLALHTGERSSDTCRFCGQPITPLRIRALEDHFSDTLKRFQAEIEEHAKGIKESIGSSQSMSLPDAARLYDHFADEYQKAGTEAREVLDDMVGLLEAIHCALVRKRDFPFETDTIDRLIQDADSICKRFRAVIERINRVISDNNSFTSRLQKEIDTACRSLEQHYVSEKYEQYQQLREGYEVARDRLVALTERSRRLEKEIEDIEAEIVEHQRPAEELNIELRSYLGRGELCFEVREKGYRITRNGRVANNLSEGEKTAIAFLYFLKSLQDKSFNLSKGVVVIDDPVSSLDANSLFSAFGYMKERTKGAGQLFVLTHNFGLFRQIKNWFHHLPNQRKKDVTKRPGRFFMLVTSQIDGRRSASIDALDPLLEEFECEYHYLFKRVYQEACRDSTSLSLEEYYGIPNLARRLVETFLAFQYPHLRGELYDKFEKVDFDPSKKTRILRFLHTYSHSDIVAEMEHDPTVLIETRPVLVDLLEMIKSVDTNHWDGMMKLIITETPEDDE